MVTCESGTEDVHSLKAVAPASCLPPGLHHFQQDKQKEVILEMNTKLI